MLCQSRTMCALALTLLAVQPTLGQDDLPAQPAAEAVAPVSAKEMSYALGLNFATEVRSTPVQLDQQALLAGVTDGLQENGKPQMTQERMQQCMMALSQLFERQARQQMAEAAGSNEKEGAAFLAAFAKQEGVQTTPSGLMYRVIKPGTGASPTASSVVECHYEGKLIDGTVFDSSFERGEPAQFPVGRVIPGWTEALQKMKAGAEWEVVLPSKIAYGAEGTPGGPIGPNQVLIFRIELLRVVR
ncbi:Peptidyl-prolyl cis-trans isomerase Mip precursor [Pirellulimonas nuda]|uniref:Peptidyl-prolyl cis-trans isomerase n=2 Tax=Pirellulimonas nuda TaxID=2528009 RepID=A0A518DJQ7_9BACT|nr:FKBP-type peptidyl-prolyl cis-trans isomerase [Pirellulimonas nuda]QDU91711.1 Peptidyl-prolyl cis-trans isomerase Mip precursor [Pirellulimonas nuda]